MIDNGVRIDHEEFTLGGNRAVPGWSVGCHSADVGACGDEWLYEGVITPAKATLCGGHGTHCASTAAGYQYGIAKGAEIVPVQVLSCAAGEGTSAGLIAGMEWAVQDAADHPDQHAVLSISIGGSRSIIENRAVKAATDAGVVVVVAAGNENVDACHTSPASAAEALTVGSTDSSDAMSHFSNHGECAACDGGPPSHSLASRLLQRRTRTPCPLSIVDP